MNPAALCGFNRAVLGQREHGERFRALTVRLHSTGVSLQETAAALESIGVFRSHQAIFQWTHRVGAEAPDPPTAKPSRIAVDETANQIGREQYWLYAAIDVDSKLLLGVRVLRWRGNQPASAFLSELKKHHNLLEAKFLVDGMGYLTALAETVGHLNYVTRNLIEKWFQTLKMRVKRFHNTWMGGRASAGSPPPPSITISSDRIKHSITARRLRK